MIKFYDKRHYYFLAIYLVTNYILHILSITDAVYVHGADASRYFVPALSLANGDGLGNLLSTGPIYPFFLSIHYAIFGFDYGNDALVVTQSALLYLTGIIASKIAIKIMPNLPLIRWITMLLVIFNPNALMAAHLVQTETLFTLFLVSFLYVLMNLIRQRNGIVVLAFIALLISLTRPAGMYIMLIFILLSLILKLNGVSWRKLVSINLVYYLILLSGLGLWSLNNYNKHGEFFISANEGMVFHDQYIALLQYGKNMSQSEANVIAYEVYEDMIVKESAVCNKGVSSFECRKIVSRAYIDAILNENLYVIAKASISSFVNLMFSGGASNFANYYGIDNKASVLSFERSSGSMLSLSKAIKFIDSVNIKYLIALITFWGFAILTKILLIIGLIHVFSNSNNKYLSIIVIFYILLFSAEYLFLGQSRWRGPLDPLIMIFSALGVLSTINFYKKS